MCADTASLVGEDDDHEAGATAHLVVCLRVDRPQEPAARHLLHAVDVVEIGRGKAAGARRDGRTVRTLALTLADPALSEAHARLTRLHGRWRFEDLGSKNRSHVNGAPATTARLDDGDVIDLGQTVLLFRDARPVEGPDDARLGDVEAPLGLRTMSGALAATHRALAAVAPSALPVVLVGATGTGKEVAARAVHAASGRRGAFVAVNCGAIAPQLVESELFGHRRGAFSGATTDRAGHVRSSDGGTLFLDEIAELPLPAQAALLRVLQQREVVPVGDSLPIAVDLRVVAATHADLAARVADGRFRADLLARLDGLTVTLPPLAERREDLGALIGELLARAGAADKPLTVAAARALWQHDWPGNVRELELALARAVALAGTRTIEVSHLPPAVQDAGRQPAPAPDDASLSDEDRALRARLEDALTAGGGNISAVARELGKARWQIHRWLRRFGLDPQRFRA